MLLYPDNIASELLNPLSRNPGGINNSSNRRFALSDLIDHSPRTDLQGDLNFETSGTYNKILKMNHLISATYHGVEQIKKNVILFRIRNVVLELEKLILVKNTSKLF